MNQGLYFYAVQNPYCRQSFWLLAIVFGCSGPILKVNAQLPARIFESAALTDNGRQYYTSIGMDVLVDHLGRVWLATLGSGIVRFDGYNYVRYEYNPEDSFSLKSNRVLKLLESSDHSIWAITYAGLECLDLNSGRFRHFGEPPEVAKITHFAPIDDQRFLVLTTRQIWEFNALTGHFQKIEGSTLLPFKDLCKDKNAQFWGISNEGLIQIDLSRHVYHVLPLKLSGKTLITAYNSIFCIDTSRFLLSTNVGLLEYQLGRTFAQKTNLPDSLQKLEYNACYTEASGELWLGCNRGLVHWNQKYRKTETFFGENSNFNNIPNYITALDCDRLGNLWIATGTGLRKTRVGPINYQLYQIKIGHDLPENRIRVLLEGKNGRICMSSETALFESAGLGKPTYPLPLPPGKKILPFPCHFGVSPEGDFLFSWRNGGMGILRAKNRHIESFLPDTIFGGKPIETHLFDKYDRNIVWFGSLQGLWRYNLKTGEHHCYTPKPFIHNDPRVYEIIDDGHGGFWCQMIGGMAYFTKESGKFSEVTEFNTLEKQQIRSEILDTEGDAEGNVWIAYVGGVAKMSRKGNGIYSIYQFGPKNGLLLSSFMSIKSDREGNMWVGMNGTYVQRINPITYNITTYDVMDPMLTRPMVRKFIQSTQSGQFVLCTTEGMVVFDPFNLWRDTHSPELTLNRILVNNLDKNILNYDGKNLILAPNENAISIEFAGIHLNSPYSNLYQYKLIGYDTAWVNCDAIWRRASYTNLPPGQYKFKLRAANSDGVWSAEKSLVQFVINPPYWQSDWFRFWLILLFSGIAYGVLYYRMQQNRLSEAKKLAEQNARYKSMFLANMSHEIRTPMNAILGLSRLLDENLMDDRQRVYTRAIRDSSEDLLQILNDILDYSKIESGKFTFQSRSFDLQELLDQLFQTFSYLATEKALKFEILRAPEVPIHLEGDPTRLKQILNNLVGNALKFTENGEVMVALTLKMPAEKDRVKIQFEVTDTGIGIGPAYLEQVFESFNQAQTGESSSKGGTGLGLSIAKQLVEQQGGEIELHSMLGKGTRLCFWIPFKQIDHVSIEGKISDFYDYSHLNNLHILLVEDTYFNQLLAIELLQYRIPGIKITVAENGQIALDLLEKNTFDLILMDIKMPVMDGLTATRQIRMQYSDRPVPIIGLTANAVPEELEKCRAVGMNDWIIKPIEAEALLAAIFKQVQTNA